MYMALFSCYGLRVIAIANTAWQCTLVQRRLLTSGEDSLSDKCLLRWPLELGVSPSLVFLRIARLSAVTA